MIYLAADHGGFRLKKKLKVFLTGKGFEVRDLGPERLEANDDYPAWAAKLAKALQKDSTGYAIGLCRSGAGMAIAANKFWGVRAIQAFNPTMAKKTRQDENANFLSLGADYHTWPEVQKIVMAWLKTSYQSQARFERRLRQIAKLEHGR